mgnify:FL=1
MATKSSNLYKVCQSYFGITSSLTQRQKINFGQAIGTTESKLKSVFEQKSIAPIDEYFALEKKQKLVVSFLNGFLNIAESKTKLFEKYLRFEDKISIPTPGHAYNKIVIKLTYVHNLSENSLALLTYGPSTEITIELGILRCLYTKFSSPANFDKYNEYEYWNLRSGTVQRIRKNQIKSINIQNVLPAIYRLVDG